MQVRVQSGWYHKLSSVLFAIFCFELGVFLVVFPWTVFWDVNYFSWIPPESLDQLPLAQWWRGVWLSPTFRGAVSGVGIVNLYIALRAVFGLRRYASPPPPPVDPDAVSIE